MAIRPHAQIQLHESRVIHRKHWAHPAQVYPAGSWSARQPPGVFSPGKRSCGALSSPGAATVTDKVTCTCIGFLG